MVNLLKTLKKNGNLVVVKIESFKIFSLKGRDVILFEPLVEEDAVPDNASKILKAPLQDLS